MPMPEVLKRVGRYDLLEVIGRGGAAVVYLALQRDLQRHVALKELAPFHLADSSFAERFVDESRLAGAMSHANVVTVHEYFEDGSVPYIAMEYLPHGSLRQYIGRLTTAQIAGVLEGVLAGLAHGEAHGIVHRDLKPENLLVAVDGRVKIADFGVARAYSRAATRAVVTVAGTTIGTPAYMSPEQALGTDLTAATDLYSLGVVAWEMLTGQVPFEETDTPVAVLYRHVHEEVPSVRTLAPDVDDGIARWLERMLAKRPEDRYQSADIAWMDLEDVILELLGPRWRREARLPVEAGGPRAGRTLTPASFDASPRERHGNPPGPFTPPPGETPAPAAAPIPQTVSGPAAVAAPGDGADAGRATVAPQKRQPRTNTTMFRLARRHREVDDEEPPAAANPARRWLAVLAIVAAMAAAAVAGVLVGAPGSARSPHHGPSAAQRRAAAAAAAAAAQKAQATASADLRLAGIAQRLATSRNRAVTALLNAKTPQRQAIDAAAGERAYAAAAARARRLRGDTPLAGPLAQTLAGTATAYRSWAAAARTDSERNWKRAQQQVRTDERRLQAEVATLPQVRAGKR